MITVTINGEARQIDSPISIEEFLIQHNLQAKMVVVEHNLHILSRDLYSVTAISAGDNLEIVQMMAGG